MLLYPHFVPLIILLVSSSSALSISNIEGQLVTNHDQKGPSETFDLPVSLSRVRGLSSSPKMVNVDDYGAKSDGTDDSKAFKIAWKKACASKNAVLVVPKNRIYHLKPVTFAGPCNFDLTVRIDGTITASNDPSDYSKDPRHWLVFENLTNFSVRGHGKLNGNGKTWWKNSCKIDKSLPCKEAPTAITFLNCKNLGVSGIRSKNAQKIHISFQKCVNVKARNLAVVAPGKSPNTDGIHVTGTQNILIMDCVIKTGDDCISIVSGSRNVKVKDIRCGPGHGISIGSLGKGYSHANVSNVFVNRAKLSGTTNGVRIKTWQGGSGYAKNIIFQNIAMHNVSNPIIIDQNYCDQTTPCQEQDSAVKIQNVVYKNIRGTSASELAIKLECSSTFPCEGIVLQNINLTRESAGTVEASCNHANGLSSRGRVSPHCS